MAEGNEAITRFGRRSLVREPGRLRPVNAPPGRIGGGPPGGPRLHRPRRQPRPVRLDGMGSGYLCSALLHGLAFLLILLGLPSLFRHEPLDDQPVAVQLVNISALTRATQRNPHPVKEAKIETPPPVAPSPKPTPPKPAVEPPPAPPPPQETKAPPPAPAPEPKPVPAPPPPPPPKPVPKPEPPKPVAKPKPPKTQQSAKQQEDFDQLLKNLAHTAESTERADQPAKPLRHPPATQAASAQPDAPLGSEISTSLKDQLAAAVEQCWYDDPGARGNGAMSVVIRVWVGPDGTVQRTEIVDAGDQMADPVFRAFAERARRAPLVSQCNRLPIPPDKYEQLKVFTFTFTPKGVS